MTHTERGATVARIVERAAPFRDPMQRPNRGLAGKTILVTGGAGVIGQALLPGLRGANTICLVHRRPIEAPNVVCLEGDITRPRLSLPVETFKRTASRLDCIVHLAAVTDFGASDATIHDANVVGTENVLELAAQARVPVYHVSTAFVHPPSRSNQEPTAYELSKHAGDQLVRNSGVPAIVLRPSLVIGDSRTGVISQFQGIYLVIGLFFRGLLPLVPASAEAYVDVVPRDIVASAIAALIEQEVTHGEYWLTAGDRAPTVARLALLCVRYAERLLGHSVEAPRLVPSDVFDRLIRPVFMPELPSGLRRTLEMALQFSRYIDLEQPFPSSLQSLERWYGAAPLPSPEATLLRSLEYWAQTAGLARTARRRETKGASPACPR